MPKTNLNLKAKPFMPAALAKILASEKLEEVREFEELMKLCTASRESNDIKI